MIGHKLVGSGEKKVFIFSGWMGDFTVFNPCLNFFNTEDFTYIFMDYRGYGLSKETQGEYSIKQIAKDALELADHLDIQSFDVIGHSMGGLVVQQLALLAPKRVGKLIGICPVPANGYPMNEEFQTLFDGAVEEAQNRATILDFTTGNRLTKTWVEKMTKASFDTTTKQAYGDYLKAWTKTDISSEVSAAELKQDVLVLVGEFDPAIPKEMIEQTYKNWFSNFSMKTLPNAGHYPMQETPVWLVSTIENFLNA